MVRCAGVKKDVCKETTGCGWIEGRCKSKDAKPRAPRKPSTKPSTKPAVPKERKISASAHKLAKVWFSHQFNRAPSDTEDKKLLSDIQDMLNQNYSSGEIESMLRHYQGYSWRPQSNSASKTSSGVLSMKAKRAPRAKKPATKKVSPSAMRLAKTWFSHQFNRPPTAKEDKKLLLDIQDMLNSNYSSSEIEAMLRHYQGYSWRVQTQKASTQAPVLRRRPTRKPKA